MKDPKMPTKKLPDLRNSARKLYPLLPASFVIRMKVAGRAIVAAEIVTADGKPTDLDFAYPGFTSGLDALVQAGLVLAWGAAKKPGATGIVESLFTTVRATEAAA